MKMYVWCLSLLLGVLLLVGPVGAQPVGPEGPDAEMDGPPMGPGGPHMGPGGPHMGPGGPGMRGPGGKPSPEQQAKMKKLQAMRSTAEAYKNLSELYKEQGKIDEAVAQLKKILALANDPEGKDDPRVKNQLGRVYLEIAELYVSKDRLSDAEAIINEGVEKTKGDNPEISSRMLLTLGNIYRKKGKTAEAEKVFQRVIELNTGK